MYKKIAILLVCTFLVVSLAIIGNAEAEGKVFKWRAVTHQMVGTDRYQKTFVVFCENVKKASGGRLIIEPYGAGVLFPVSESLNAVMNGVVEMGAVWSGYWAGINPMFAIVGNRPGSPITEFSECLYNDEKCAPIVEKVYKKVGVQYLGTFDFAPPEILCSTVPIRTLDDFKGLVIRTSGPGANFYSRLGASAVSLSGPEVYTALQLGTIDAAEYNDWAVNKQMGFDEVTTYVIEPCLHMGSNEDKALIVNPKAWKNLPDDLKAIVIACRDQARYNSAITFSIDSKISKREWINEGVKIINLPEEGVKKARKIGSEVMLDYAKKNPESAEYVAMYAQDLYNLGYIEEAKTLGYTK